MSLLKERQREVGEKEGLVELIKGVIKGEKIWTFVILRSVVSIESITLYSTRRGNKREREWIAGGGERLSCSHVRNLARPSRSGCSFCPFLERFCSSLSHTLY